MCCDPPTVDDDHEELALDLAALAYPARLELLKQLHVPRTLSELRVRARRGEGAEVRPSSMQAILAHVEKLRERALVTVGRVASHGRELTTYAVDPQRLYAIVEALRAVGAQHAGRGKSADETGTLQDAPSGMDAQGPRLVVVHGWYEGHAFLLEGRGAWVLGRDPRADAAVDYDPFVSSRNSTIERTAFGYRVRDEKGSKNGTSVNWKRLPAGGARDLQHGDVIGVGKTLLVFYER